MQQVVYNGKIYVDKNRFVEAIMIEDNRITMIGTDEEVLLEAHNAKLIDCQGNTVIPGLNDSHLHLLNMALGYTQVQLNDCQSIDEIITKSRAFIKTNPDLCKGGLIGRGWNQDLFTNDKRIPDRHDLDKISTTIPIALKRVCGHSLITNTKAIEMLKLNHESQQYEGGFFGQDDQGYPTGFFAEKACEYPMSLFSEVDLKIKRDLLLKAMDYAVSCGITSVQSNDISDMQADQDLIQMIEQIYQDEEALLRYRFQVCFKDLASFTKTVESNNYKLNIKHDWLKLGPLKLYKDGSLGARTALMKKPYHDDPGNFGIEVMSDTETEAFCTLAAKNKIQVVTHVIGDQALESMLDVYSKVMYKGNPLRNSLIHTQISSLDQLKKIAEMKICVQYQPIFLEYDLHIANERVGKELAQTSYAFKTLHDLGGKISYSTDSPVEDANPFLNIYCAVTRKDYQGYPVLGYNPQECVDVATAIDEYTVGSAYVEFQEREKGRLNLGYLADLVILEDDIFTIDPNKIKDIKPLLTMVDGIIVYRKGEMI